MKRNEFEFLLVNFRRLLLPHEQPFVFPSHVDHVFFSKSTHKLGWKVILTKANNFRQMVKKKLVVEQTSTRAKIGKGVKINEAMVPISKPSQECCIQLLVQDHGTYVEAYWKHVTFESWV